MTSTELAEALTGAAEAFEMAPERVYSGEEVAALLRAAVAKLPTAMAAAKTKEAT